MFEYTEDDVAAEFTDDDDRPLLESLIELPCLFMEEGVDDELARVGSIQRARIVGRNIVIHYTLDADIPPLQNSLIFEHREEFDIPHEFEFHRNHWAVKDVDLYRLLLTLAPGRRPQPLVFALAEHELIEDDLVSVMMPFNIGFAQVYRSIRQSVEAAGLRAQRADDIWEAPAVMQDVVSLIDRSRVVICDCTGRNPNVFYEVGIAHTLGREVILITQNEADIPFDLRHLRHVQYLDNAAGRRELSRRLQDRLAAITGG
jgi:hypothetical protein